MNDITVKLSRSQAELLRALARYHVCQLGLVVRRQHPPAINETRAELDEAADAGDRLTVALRERAA